MQGCLVGIIIMRLYYILVLMGNMTIFCSKHNFFVVYVVTFHCEEGYV